MKVKFLIPLLLCYAPWARGQCTGYSITSTNVNLLSPLEAGNKGYVAGTFLVKGAGGSWSHNATYAVGTTLTFSVKSYNTTVAPGAYYTVDNDSTKHSWAGGSIIGLNGTWTVAIPSDQLGHVFHIFYPLQGPNGSTVDEVTYSVISGPAGYINYEDGLWTNAYYELVSLFGGGSMMNNCGECQGGEIQKCLLATHTPLFDGSLTNPRTGETQTISNASAGNVAKATESVSGTASIAISVLPGDSPTGSTTNKIYCTMFGWVMSQQWNPGLPDLEMAVTAVEIIPSTCTLVLRFFQQGDDWGINCNVAWKKPPATADRCSVASQIPDFNPAAQWDEQNCKVPGNCSTSDMPPPNGTNASYPKYWYHASWGVRFPPGAPSPDPPILNGGAHNWTFPIYLAEGYVPAGPNQDWWILDLLNLAIPKGTGFPIDCTYRDHRTRPIPNPF